MAPYQKPLVKAASFITLNERLEYAMQNITADKVSQKRNSPSSPDTNCQHEGTQQNYIFSFLKKALYPLQLTP